MPEWRGGASYKTRVYVSIIIRGRKSEGPSLFLRGGWRWGGDRGRGDRMLRERRGKRGFSLFGGLARDAEGTGSAHSPTPRASLGFSYIVPVGNSNGTYEDRTIRTREFDAPCCLRFSPHAFTVSTRSSSYCFCLRLCLNQTKATSYFYYVLCFPFLNAPPFVLVPATRIDLHLMGVSYFDRSFLLLTPIPYEFLFFFLHDWQSSECRN